jgi:hypothetical protein
MDNGGATPTNMFAQLATSMRQQFYPNLDAGRIDWYDVIPAGVYQRKITHILPVQMEHANGVFAKPKWSLNMNGIPKDWVALIDETIARGRSNRDGSGTASPVELKKARESWLLRSNHMVEYCVRLFDLTMVPPE